MRYPTDINSNRIRGVVDNLIGTEDADDIMMELMNALGSDSTLVPDVGKYYVFVYRPKTPLIQYDQNPLVAVTDIFRWGFRGINYHWGQYRQYSWEEIVGSLYQIYPDEIADARELPIQKFILNS
jgi:hypothetical protein